MPCHTTPWAHPTQDSLLREVVTAHKVKNWKKIAESFPGRTDVQCLHRWQKVLNPELIKGPWTKEVGQWVSRQLFGMI